MYYISSDFPYYLYNKEKGLLKFFKKDCLHKLLDIEKGDTLNSDIIYNTSGIHLNEGISNIANRHDDIREFLMDDKYPDWKPGQVIFIDGHNVAKYKVFFSDGDNEHAVYIKPKCQVNGPWLHHLDHLDMWNWDNFGSEYFWYDDSEAIIGIHWPKDYNPSYIYLI